MAKNETYEERIKGIYVQLGGRIRLDILTELCMDMKVSEFNELEDSVHVLSETGNEDGLLELARSLNP